MHLRHLRARSPRTFIVMLALSAILLAVGAVLVYWFR